MNKTTEQFPSQTFLKRFNNLSYEDLCEFNSKHFKRWFAKFKRFPDGKPLWQINVETVLGMIYESDQIRLYELDQKVAKERNVELKEKWNEMRNELLENHNLRPGIRSDKNKISVYAFQTVENRSNTIIKSKI